MKSKMGVNLWNRFTLILIISWNTPLPNYVYAFSNPFPLWSAPTESFILDVLGWLTLRDNGVLLDQSTLSTVWIPVFKEKYEASLPFRIMLKAFQYGVLPKLTLGENENCDSTYTFEYKHWYNDSVLAGPMKNYIFDTFFEQVWNLKQGPFVPNKFCDYRQGLRCNPKTNKCECPDGSVMSPVAGAASPSTRCVLQENEICHLLDAQAGNTNDPDNPFRYEILLLPFNFEKPLGCKDGTQCRFQAGNTVSPLCYSSSGSPPWVPGPKDIAYGEECSLELYGKNGLCASPNDDSLGAVTCYNYGLSPKNETGMCSYSSGIYGGANQIHPYRWGDPFAMAYLTPRFVPLRGEKLQKYQKAIEGFIRNHNKIRTEWGYSCKIDRTKKMDEIYKFYFGLQKAPVQGQTYVATEAELDTKLTEALAIVADADTTTERICKVSGYSGGNEICMPDADAKEGNDGYCKRLNTNDQSDFYVQETAFNRKWGFEMQRSESEELADIRITKYMAEECSTGGSGFTCPENYVCYEDYNDLQPEALYEHDGKRCSLKYVNRVKKTCHDSSPDAWKNFGGCEMEILKEKVESRLNSIFSRGYKRLSMGEACNYEADNAVWAALFDTRRINAYKFLTIDPSHSARDDGFCDRSKMLECKADGRCGCMKGMAPRFTAMSNQRSDYCYFVEGACNRIDLFDMGYFFPDDLTEAMSHYGNASNIISGPISQYAPCSNGNQCVYVNEEYETCTDVDTGKTGVEPEPITPAPPPLPPPPPPSKPGEPPAGHVPGKPKPIAPAVMYKGGATLSAVHSTSAQLFVFMFIYLK